MGNLATAVGTSSVASDSDTSGSVRKTVRLGVNQEQVHQILQQMSAWTISKRAVLERNALKVNTSSKSKILEALNTNLKVSSSRSQVSLT